MRVLAVDPAIRNCGFAVIEGEGNQLKALDFGVWNMPVKLRQSECLAAIHTSLTHLIRRWEPDEVAVEGIIFVQSHRTAISMGAARACVLIAASQNGLRVFEYAPKKAKQAIVGKGNADKAQVAFMTRALLGLSETPPHDAADAMAIAIAHLSASDPIRSSVLERKEL